MRKWLRVVAPHLDFDACVAAAAEGLANGYPIASFPCSKCGATHADVGKVTKLYATHTCHVCGHK